MDTNNITGTPIIKQIVGETHSASYSVPVEIGAWLACLFFVLAMVNQAQRFIYSVRGKPTPSEQAAATSALSARLASIETKLEDQGRRIDACEKKSSEQDNVSREEHNKIYNRINETAAGIARIEGMLTASHRKG